MPPEAVGFWAGAVETVASAAGADVVVSAVGSAAAAGALWRRPRFRWVDPVLEFSFIVIEEFAF